MDYEQAAQVGHVAFALAWEVFINGQEITTHNTISAADLQEPETASSCSTNTAQDCAVGFKLQGALGVCETTCEQTTGCSATGTIITTATEPWTAAVVLSTPTATALPEPSCDLDDSSGLPSNVFDGTYKSFCAEVDEYSNLSWQVDIKGDKLDLKRRVLKARTPPPNPKTYEKYKVELAFETNQDEWGCSLSCTEAYKLLSNGGRTTGQQNIMSHKGSVNVGCGTYSYKVKSPSDECLGNAGIAGILHLADCLAANT